MSSGPVLSVCFSSDGKQIASGSWDTTVKIWNASSGELQSTLTGHTRYVPTLALLVLKVVLVADYSAMRRAVNCVGFDPTGKKLVSCSDDKTVRVWDVTTGEPIGSPLTGHSDCVNSVCFSADGDLLVSGSDDTTLKIWSKGSSGNFECKSTLTGHRYVPSLWKERLL